MKATVPTSVLVTVLCLAVVALLVDRLVLGTSGVPPRPAAASTAAPVAPRPAAEAAAVPTAAAAPSPAEARIVEAPGSEALPMTAVAERLARLGQGRAMDLANLKDLLMQPELLPVGPEAPPEPAPRAVPAPNSTDCFINEHRLTSVLVDDDGGIAIVNGKVLRVGQEIDGYRLVRLAPGIAVFTGGDTAADVSLEIITQPQRSGKPRAPADDASE